MTTVMSNYHISKSKLPKRDDLHSHYPGDTFLMHLVRFADVYPELMEQIPYYQDLINQQNSYGKSYTALMLAIMSEKADILVPMLISMGTDLTQTEFKGRTALMLSIMLRKDDIAIEFINRSKPSELDVQDLFGETVLHHVTKRILVDSGLEINSNLQIAQLLLERGANKKLKNYQGKTASEVSENHGDPEVKALIKNYWPMPSYRNYYLQNTPTQENMMYLVYLNRRQNLFPKDIEKMIIPYLWEEKKPDITSFFGIIVRKFI